jgi:ribosomal protein L29
MENPREIAKVKKRLAAIEQYIVEKELEEIEKNDD